MGFLFTFLFMSVFFLTLFPMFCLTSFLCFTSLFCFISCFFYLALLLFAFFLILFHVAFCFSFFIALEKSVFVRGMKGTGYKLMRTSLARRVVS